MNSLERIDLELTLKKRFNDGTLSSEVLDELNNFFRRVTKDRHFYRNQNHGTDSLFTLHIQIMPPWEKKS